MRRWSVRSRNPSPSSKEIIYFLHIPKTGGTSLHRLLENAIRSRGSVTSQLFWDDIARGSSPIGSETRVIVGHLTGLFPLWLRRWPTVISMLRDPVNRALSHINHVRWDGNHPFHSTARDLDVVEFCADPVLRRMIDNYQSRQLASLRLAHSVLRPIPEESPPWELSLSVDEALFALGTDNGLQDSAIRMLNEIDAVGITEQFDRSSRLVSAVLGLTSGQEVPFINRTPRSMPTVADLRADEISVLEEITSIDKVVYEAASDRFDQLCSRWEV